MHTATPCDLKTPFRYIRRGCPRLHSHRGALAAVPLKRRRLHGTISGIPHHRKYGILRRYVHVRRRCALAALMPSPATSFAELCGAIVAVVARRLASETPPLRNPRVPGSTFRTGGAFLAFARPFPTAMCFSALPTETTPSFSHKRVRLLIARSRVRCPPEPPCWSYNVHH